MKILRKDTFVKDITILLLVGIVVSAVFAAGFAMATDKYFAKAVTGVIGDYGEYDLLFQGREELKTALARRIKEVIAERFPGATLKPGITVAGKSTFFVTLPSKYHTKEVFDNLDYYFKSLPGSGSFSIMTEPKLHITSIPSAIFDVIASEVEKLPGVDFTFHDGSNMGVIMKSSKVATEVEDGIKQILNKYQILEVRLEKGSYSSEDLLTLSKNVSQSLIGIKGIDYAKDITMSGSSGDYQYLMNTLSEVKKFLLSYAAEVKVVPAEGQTLEVGDLLVLNGKNEKPLKAGGVMEPLNVVVKVTSVDSSGVQGLIIQGDAEYLTDMSAYKLLTNDKIGSVVGTVEVSSRKAQLVYAMDQGVKLLTKLDQAVEDYSNSTGGAGLTVSGIEKAYKQLVQVKQALGGMKSGINGLTGKVDNSSLSKMVNLISGVGDDLDYLAKNFGRVQILENRFEQALTGLDTAQLVIGSPMLQNAFSGTGGIFDKLVSLNDQLTSVEESLRSRVQKLDDFINQFNPLVSVLVSWRNKANAFAEQVNDFGAVFTPGSENYEQMMDLIDSTDEVLSGITGFDMDEVKSGLSVVTDRVFGSDKVDLSALITELEKVKNSLPNLLDEEIGNSVELIDKYVGGGDASTGDRIQIFTKANVDRTVVDAAIKDAVGDSEVGISTLPAGTIQLDVRGELYKILGEVRSVIAALVVTILWILTFILDHSLIISMLKQMRFSFLPKHVDFRSGLMKKGYQLIQKIFSAANLYAFVIGGVWLVMTFWLAGAEVPYLQLWHLGIIGGVLGIFISILAEKINPINQDEIMAGLSLGLPFKTIMREIVIPAGRPGMLQILNRWKMQLK